MATTDNRNAVITSIQIEGNDIVSFLNDTTYIRAMSQIVPQSPAYISYTFDSITISQVGGDSFTFSVYTIEAVGGIVFLPLSFQDTPDVIQERTIEIYRLLVTSIFKGCCECGNTEPECSIQYTAGNATDPGTFLYESGVIQVNYFTANNQDFRGLWPIIQDGSWMFVFSKTDPTVYGVYQLSNYSDGGDYAQFDATLLNGPGTFPDGTELCLDVTSVGGSLVQDWQDTLNISSLLTQNNAVDGGGFNFAWDNVNRYSIDSLNYQLYNADDGAGNVGRVQIDPGAVTINGTSFIDIITPNYGAASLGWVLAYDGSGHVEYVEAGTGTISSIELLMPPAFTVSDPNPLTTDGTFTVTVDGTEDQYINGLGELATFPVYTVENGLHTKEDPASDFVFHLGGQLIEDTLITSTEITGLVTANEWQFSIRGTGGANGQNTRFPFGVANLGKGGVATFQDFATGSRPNPSVEIVGDNDTFRPLLNLELDGPLPNPGDPGIWENRNSFLSLRNTGTTSVGARISMDYSFRNTSVLPSPDFYLWPAVKLIAEATNVTENAETSNFSIRMFEGGSQQDKLLLEGKGQLTLNEYGTGTFTDGTTNINNALTYNLAVDNTGKVWKKIAGTGGTVTSVGGAGLITTTASNPFTVAGTVTTSVQQNRLVGRWNAGGTGIMQEITIGTGLTLSATGELTADGGGGTYDSDQGIYKDTVPANDTFQLGAPSGSQGAIAFSVNRFVDVSNKYLQMEGSSSILKTIQDSATPLGNSGTFISTAAAGGNDYAGIFTGHEFAALLASTDATDAYALEVSNSGTGADSFAAYIGCTNGHGIQVAQATYSVFQLNGSIPSSSSVDSIIQLTKNASGTPSVGQGLSIVFDPGRTSDGASIVSGTVLNSIVTDITPLAGAAEFRIDTLNAGASLNHTTFKGSGQLKLHQYTTSTSFAGASGAAVGVLKVDNTGNVFVGTAGGSSPLTTKGDIYTFGTADTRLPVGTNGYVLSADSTEATGLKWINSTGGVPTTRLVSTTAPLAGGGALSSDLTLSIPLATNSADGYLSATDRTAFNLKENALTFNSPLSRITNTISIPAATTSADGYLTSTDWNTFNGKVPSSRSLTINGTTYDLSADRSWTISGTSPLTTKGDLYTFGTADTRLPVGLNTQVLLADSSTPTGLRWGTNTTPPASGYYGAFQDTTSQTAASINTAYPVKFNTTDLSNGVTVVNDGSSNPTRVTLANTGVYNIQFSLQMEKTGGSGNMIADIWIRKNGVDVPSTTGKIVLTGSANASPVVAAWNYVLNLVAGDYVQLMWSTSNTNVEIVAAGPTAPHPAIPSSILTVTQQAGILAGTGITAINSLTGAAQTLTVGTTGTDFAIVDSGSDHKFNLPTASAANRGALSNTDWTRFDSFKTQTIGVTVDGSGGTITAGVKGYIRIPYACTITSWSILTGNAGTGATITFDIWRANNAIPTVANSIVGGGTKPFLTSNTAQITSAAPSGWTATTLAANDILGFNVESGAAVFSWANLQLTVTRT